MESALLFQNIYQPIDMTKKTLEERTAKYETLYRDKIYRVERFKKQGESFYEVLGADNKRIGRAFKVDSAFHKTLYRLFPNSIPRPKGFVIGKYGKRLVREENVDIFRGYKKADYEALGFKTRKEGEEAIRDLRNNKKLRFTDEEDFKVFMERSRILALKQAKDIGQKIKDSAIRAERREGNYRNFLESWFLTKVNEEMDYRKFLSSSSLKLSTIIRAFMEKQGSCKIQLNMKVKFAKYKTTADSDGNQWRTLTVERRVEEDMYSFPKEINNVDQIRSKVQQSIAYLNEKLEKYIRDGSGWVVEDIPTIYLNIAEYGFYAGSYFPPDAWLKNKKGCRFPQNTDSLCWFYSVFLACYAEELGNKMKKITQAGQTKLLKREMEKVFEFDYSICPVTENGFVNKVTYTENIIKKKIHILQYQNGSKMIKPLYKSDNEQWDDHIILMLLISEDGKQRHFGTLNSKNNFQYALSSLLSMEQSKHKERRHYCMSCLKDFNCEKSLKEHEKDLCGFTRTSLPDPEKAKMTFRAHSKMMEVPFVFYLDQEALIVPKEHDEDTRTHKTHRHEACGISVRMVNRLTKKVEVIFFSRAKDSVRKGQEAIIRKCADLYHQHFRKKRAMTLTEEEKNVYIGEWRTQKKPCHICQGTEGDFPSWKESRDFCKENNKPFHPLRPVIDHCHSTGEIRGVAHSRCNLRYQRRPYFAVFAHNMKGYDSNFLIKNIRDGDCNSLRVVPINRNKFITFSMNYQMNHEQYDEFHQNGVVGGKLHTTSTEEEEEDEEEEEEDMNIEYTEWIPKTHKWSINYVDSQSFLNASLEKLAKSLETKDFKGTAQFIKERCPWADEEEQKQLLNLFTQKGFYPYEYMDSWDRFKETELPPLKHFVSMLKYETRDLSQLSDKQRGELVADELRAKLIWKKFRCQDMGDWHDLYLNQDVVLLIDIFERFRDIFLEKFNLDPAHYMTLPGIGWDAMLKYLGETLQLFDNSDGHKDMYEFNEKGKIGGISSAGGLRYARANHKYLSDFDPSKPKSWLLYLDANALYSWAMCQELPYKDFRWIDNPESFDLIKAMENIDGKDQKGYMLQVDAELPEELHDFFNDYCPFPENIQVTSSMLSERQKKVAGMLNVKDSKIKKLVLNLMPKQRYIVHIKTLKLWMDLGCKVTKIHRVMEFTQKAWLKPFIEQCMTERQGSKTKFEKDFWKLLSNSIYGKTMEDVRKRVNIFMETDDNKIKRHINKMPEQKGARLPTPINEHGLMIIDMPKTKVTLNKPVYAGVAILSLSKYLMYDYFYNILKKKYGEGVRLLYTDTDSFIIQIFTKDFYEDMRRDRDFMDTFDLSEYPENHPLFEGLSTEVVSSLMKKNKKVQGKFKDEGEGVPAVECAVIRAKCYSILYEGGDIKSTAKGCKSVVKENIHHQTYVDTVLHDYDINKMMTQAEMTTIRSYPNQELYTLCQTKVVMSSVDDKRYDKDGINLLAFGHKDIPAPQTQVMDK